MTQHIRQSAPPLRQFIFGADYNPEQWTEAIEFPAGQIWGDDIILMRQGGATLRRWGC